MIFLGDCKFSDLGQVLQKLCTSYVLCCAFVPSSDFCQLDIMRLEIMVTITNWLGESTAANASAWIQLDQARLGNDGK